MKLSDNINNKTRLIFQRIYIRYVHTPIILYKKGGRGKLRILSFSLTTKQCNIQREKSTNNLYTRILNPSTGNNKFQYSKTCSFLSKRDIGMFPKEKDRTLVIYGLPFSFL